MDNNSRSGMTAIVEFDYNAKDSSELTLVKGAMLTNVKELGGGRYEGTTQNGKTGLFHENLVKFLHGDDKVVMRDKSATVNRRCKAVYSYTQNNDDELSLAVGDVIEFLEEVEEGWWRGKLRNKVGVFPSNFVVTVEQSPLATTKKIQTKKSLYGSKEDLMSTLASVLSVDKEKDAPILPPKPVSAFRSSNRVEDEIEANLANKFREMCQVMFPYKPASEDELELNTGDIITILSKELPDKGWWKGELKGKIGVFPDNFVKIITDVPENDGHGKHGRPPIPSKVIVNKSPNSTTATNAHRKDSFGSKDSLNEGPPIQIGHVAAHRLSLENRSSTVDITNKSGGFGGGGGFESTKASSDLRKSLENLNEKKTPAPPVLTKKPSVPIKKSPTIGSVTGNLISGIKQKVKGVGDHHQTKNNNNSTSLTHNTSNSSSHDSFDGIGGSKMNNNNHSQVADNGERGIVGERIRKDDSDFNTVERGSFLQDVRANRAKAPKRRLPTGNSLQGDSSGNSSSITLNGSSMMSESSVSDSPPPTTNNLDDEMAKPKPRNWEKQKAPWMAELKLSQMKKSGAGSIDSKIESHRASAIEPTTTSAVDMDPSPKMNDMSKSFSTSYVGGGHRKSTDASVFETRANSVEVRSSMIENTTSSHITTPVGMKKDLDNSLTKSMTSLSGPTSVGVLSGGGATKISIISENSATTTQTSTADEPKSSRPLSVNLRNRSISPIGRSGVKSIHVPMGAENSTTTTSVTHHQHLNNNHDPSPLKDHHHTHYSTSSTINATQSQPSSVSSSTIGVGVMTTNDVGVNSRVIELEQRITRLEKIVSSQGTTIDDLVKTLRDEKDKVKVLKTELDKYAQCVTQV